MNFGNNFKYIQLLMNVFQMQVVAKSILVQTTSNCPQTTPATVVIIARKMLEKWEQTITQPIIKAFLKWLMRVPSTYTIHFLRFKLFFIFRVQY